MALGGTYQDHYLDLFKGLVDHEAQQKISRLSIIPAVEMLSGNKTFFDKLGSNSSYNKTSRGEVKTFSNLTFERRQVQETFASFDHILDKEDLIKYVENPQNMIIESAASAMGRQKDSIIMSAIQGNAVVTTNGSTANQALTLSVAVNDHSYDSGSGDVALTPSKLKEAIRLLQQNYGYDGSQKLFCVAPIGQIMELASSDEVINKDFRSSAVLEAPGVHKGISGYLGIDFIAYEDTGVDGNADEQVYLLTGDAIRLGVFQEMKAEILKDTTRVGNPDTISVTQALGAVRMHEEKVVEILCDPRKS